MDFSALLQSTPWIVVHTVGAILALLLGTSILLMKKGTALHKACGRVWTGLMLVVATTSFFITELRVFGPYSPIHILSVITLLGLFAGWRAARTGDIRSHRFSMVTVYLGGLIGAGAFTLLPGRIMHRVVFADGGQMAFWAMLGVTVIAGAGLWLRRRSASV